MEKFSTLLRASRKDPKKAVKVSTIKLLSPIIGNRKYTKFMVLTDARTGSNLLLSYLNSHPNIYSEGEVFWKLEGRDYRDILAKTYGKQPSYIKAKGFKIFYYHPLDVKENCCKLWDKLEDMKDIKIIHLRRKNVLKSLVSVRIALNNEEWMSTHNNKDKPKSKSITIPEEWLIDLFNKTESRGENADNRFSQHQVHHVYYEDFVSNPEQYYKILDFLGVERRPPHTVLTRQNPEKLYDLVENYAELKRAFSDTKWASMFVD